MLEAGGRSAATPALLRRNRQSPRHHEPPGAPEAIRAGPPVNPIVAEADIASKSRQQWPFHRHAPPVGQSARPRYRHRSLLPRPSTSPTGGWQFWWRRPRVPSQSGPVDTSSIDDPNRAITRSRRPSTVPCRETDEPRPANRFCPPIEICTSVSVGEPEIARLAEVGVVDLLETVGQGLQFKPGKPRLSEPNMTRPMHQHHLSLVAQVNRANVLKPWLGSKQAGRLPRPPFPQTRQLRRVNHRRHAGALAVFRQSPQDGSLAFPKACLPVRQT